MENPYRTKMVVAADGERLPVLIHRANGMPLFDPSVYISTQVRGRSQAAATIERHLRAIMHLLVFAEVEGIDLDQRIWMGSLLAPHELDALVEAAGRPIKSLISSLANRRDRPEPAASAGGPRSLERFRARLNAAETPAVDPASAGTRLRAIRDYIKWLAERRIGQLIEDSEIAAYRDALQRFIEGIDARVPSTGRHDTSQLPEGLSEEHIQQLLEVIDPEASNNPWTDGRARIRNRLIVQWLLGLGIRRGELLAVRIPDIKAMSQEVSIKRRPDSPDDPRARQPLVKTKGRNLPMTAIFQDTERYILEVRGAIPSATKHPFLFVDVRTGRPLSLSGLTKVFRDLSAALGFLVTPHLLRHSWNDRFSALMDQKKVPETTEKKVRSYLQGWSETSNSAAVYTRRHVRDQAAKQMLAMQERIFKKGPEGDDERK